MNEKQAILLLKKHSTDKKSFEIVLKHSKAVQKLALKIAKNKNVDKGFIKIAGILHDIGRFKHPPRKCTIKHGIAGAEILRKEGLDKYANVAERHLGIGIRKTDIIKQKLSLPKKDFLPKTKEEMIITYADNLIAGDKIKDEKYAEKRYRKELGEEFVKRLKKFNKIVRDMK